MVRRDIEPIDALRRIAGRWRGRRPVETPVEEALGRFLAAPLEIPAAPDGGDRPRTAIDGYGLRGGAGEVLLEDRFEAGDLLPPGIDRIVPLASTVLAAAAGGGPPRVRIVEGALPPPGHGILRPREAPLVFPAGTRIGARLQALLLARGPAAAATFPPLRIGVLSIGGDLTDISGEAAPGAAAHRDLSGFWLPIAIRELGHIPCPLGIAGDEPSEGREALLRALRQKFSAVICAGGLGEGVGDRTLELFHRTGGEIDVESVALRPGGLCAAGDWSDLRLLAIAGTPLEGAAAFDIFVRPALLSAQGAPPAVWDWSLQPLPAELLEADGRPAPVPGARPLWMALPVRSRGGRRLSVIAGAERSLAFAPVAPGQVGWAVLRPPPGTGDPREAEFFHVQGVGN